MKKYIIAIVSVLFIFTMPFVFTEISASYEEPYNILENPLPWLVLITFLGVLSMLIWLVIAALNKVQSLEDQKMGFHQKSLKTTLVFGSKKPCINGQMQKKLIKKRRLF